MIHFHWPYFKIINSLDAKAKLTVSHVTTVKLAWSCFSNNKTVDYLLDQFCVRRHSCLHIHTVLFWRTRLHGCTCQLFIYWYTDFLWTQTTSNHHNIFVHVLCWVAKVKNLTSIYTCITCISTFYNMQFIFQGGQLVINPRLTMSNDFIPKLK